MLFVHDVHGVIGAREFDFEDAYREYASAVADDDTRLLWYLYAAHGAGDAYYVVTITALRDGTAWERLVEDLRYGKLAEWSTTTDAMRYSASSTLLVATDWSPLAGLDLAEIPAGPAADHPVALYREDTLGGPGIEATLAPAASRTGREDDILHLAAAFRPALGVDHTATLLYRVPEDERWETAFGTDTGWDDWPGSLTRTFPEGISGTARFLRTALWSPLA